MANLSQIRREQMLSFLAKLKEKHTDDESLIAFNMIERELTSKKYGIVWEDHEEDVDNVIKTSVPVLTEEKDLAINMSNNEPCNYLIEGEKT